MARDATGTAPNPRHRQEGPPPLVVTAGGNDHRPHIVVQVLRVVQIRATLRGSNTTVFVLSLYTIVHSEDGDFNKACDELINYFKG